MLNLESPQELSARLLESYTDKNFKAPEGFIVPFERTVIVKKSGNADMMTTDAGVLLVESSANNHLIPNIGLVYAVGPKCNEHIKPGMRVVWNQFSNLEIMIKGEVYMLISDHDVYGALPPESFARIDGLTDKEVGTKERIIRQEGFHERKHLSDLNELDKKEETFKKKFGSK